MRKWLLGWLLNLYNLISLPEKFCYFMCGEKCKKCCADCKTCCYNVPYSPEDYKYLPPEYAFFCCDDEALSTVWDALVACTLCILHCIFPCCFKSKDKKHEKFRRLSTHSDPEQGSIGLEEDSKSLSSTHLVVEETYIKQTTFVRVDNTKFAFDSRVRFLDREENYQGGTVMWTGYRRTDPFNKRMVVRLDEGQLPGSTDGVFDGERLAPYERGVHYKMLAVDKVSPISLKLGDYCVMSATPQRLCMPTAQGFVRDINGSRVTMYPIDMDFAMNFSIQSQSTSKFEYADYLLTKAPPPVIDERSDPAAPITAVQLDRFCGRNKGIQGQRNSCYLDTLLFSLFAFSDVLLDDLLAMEQEGDCDGSFYNVLNCLRYGVAYPLRASHFVSDNHVDYLRRLISKETGKEQFEGQTRDIPECMEALFGQILKWTPTLEIGSVEADGNAYFNRSFVVEIVSADNVAVPTTQNLLEDASLMLQFCFRKTPNFMILQLPREVGHSSLVIPSLELNLKNILHRSHKKCFSCQGKATLQFPGLFGSDDGLAACFLCQDCAAQRGLKTEEARQVPEAESGEAKEPESRLELSAVLCIERSHYNCFVRCENRWVFFDSMSDQEELIDHLQTTSDMGGRTKQFNIPVVEQVPDFHKWISGSEEEFKKDRLRSFLNKLGKDSHANRLFSYAYMCLYTVNTATR